MIVEALNNDLYINHDREMISKKKQTWTNHYNMILYSHNVRAHFVSSTQLNVLVTTRVHKANHSLDVIFSLKECLNEAHLGKWQ